MLDLYYKKEGLPIQSVKEILKRVPKGTILKLESSINNQKGQEGQNIPIYEKYLLLFIPLSG